MLTGEEGEVNLVPMPEREQPGRKKRALSEAKEREGCCSALLADGACWSTSHSGFTYLPPPWTGSFDGTAAMCYSSLMAGPKDRI